MRYVIIGNSTAAVAAIEGIRSVDNVGEITVLTDEIYEAYGRPLISYYLWGKTTPEKMHYRPADFYEKNGVLLRRGETVVSIDPERKTVALQSGEKVAYDKLLVAAGSRPFVPPMEGLETVQNKFSFMKFDDALALERAICKDSRLLVVGAGLIGLKCVEGILERVASVDVVDLADRILSSVLDEGGAATVRAFLEKKGVKFHLGDSVVAFSENEASLKSGGKIGFDVLVLAVGVRPNAELVKDAGGETSRGIVTDDRQETSLKDVYAAGDCAESVDVTDGRRKVLALLPNAYYQGRTAGINMAGGEARLNDCMPLNAVGFFGLHVLTAGAYVGEVYEEHGENTYKKLFVQDGLLKGFILIGDVARAGIYTALIRERTPLDSVDFEMLRKAPALAAFAAAERREKLAKKV